MVTCTDPTMDCWIGNSTNRGWGLLLQIAQVWWLLCCTVTLLFIQCLICYLCILTCDAILLHELHVFMCYFMTSFIIDFHALPSIYSVIKILQFLREELLHEFTCQFSTHILRNRIDIHIYKWMNDILMSTRLKIVYESTSFLFFVFCN